MRRANLITLHPLYIFQACGVPSEVESYGETKLSNLRRSHSYETCSVVRKPEHGNRSRVDVPHNRSRLVALAVEPRVGVPIEGFPDVSVK